MTVYENESTLIKRYKDDALRLLHRNINARERSLKSGIMQKVWMQMLSKIVLRETPSKQKG